MHFCSFPSFRAGRLQLRTYTVPNCSLGSTDDARLQKRTPNRPPSMRGLKSGSS